MILHIPEGDKEFKYVFVFRVFNLVFVKCTDYLDNSVFNVQVISYTESPMPLLKCFLKPDKVLIIC